MLLGPTNNPSSPLLFLSLFTSPSFLFPTSLSLSLSTCPSLSPYLPHSVVLARKPKCQTVKEGRHTPYYRLHESQGSEIRLKCPPQPCRARQGHSTLKVSVTVTNANSIITLHTVYERGSSGHFVNSSFAILTLQCCGIEQERTLHWKEMGGHLHP